MFHMLFIYLSDVFSRLFHVISRSGALVVTRVPSEAHHLGCTARMARLYRQFGHFLAARKDFFVLFVSQLVRLYSVGHSVRLQLIRFFEVEIFRKLHQDSMAGAFVLVDNLVFRRQSRLAWQTLGHWRAANQSRQAKLWELNIERKKQHETAYIFLQYKVVRNL